MAWKPWIRRLELGSTVLLALSYGSNEAQKIAGLLFLSEVTLPALPGPGFLSSLPVILAGAALAAGTMTGGYNMMSTVGRRIVKINMDRALSSQLASVLVVEFANVTGLPISCTQVVTGSVMGVGTEDRPRSMNWGITLRILASWILTLPAAALCGSAVYLLIHH
jgi:PiT family inorganic phosphate transporter